MIQLTTGESIEFSRWIAKHCALHRWDDHLVPQMLSLLPDLAIEVVLSHLKSDAGKSASVLAALKDLSSYNADLVEYMLSVPKLTELIPSVFANAFDTFPVEALHRCIESPCINQETLLFRLGTTSNPLHRSIHAELIHRVLNAPTNLHHYRYVANMLRGHTTEDTDSLLRNAEGVGSDNWLWLVREVEAARGERLINEAGELRRKQDIKSATTNLAGAEPQDTEASRAITKKPTQLLKKYWHDPVWSKVIATVILALFALIASLLDLPDFKITKSQQLISPQLTSQNDLHKLDIQIRHSISELKREIYYSKDFGQLAEALSRIEKSEAMYPEFKDVPLDVLIEQAKNIVKDPQEKIFIGNAYNEIQTLRTFQRGYMEHSKKILKPISFMDQKKLIQQKIAFSFNVREWNINISFSN